MHKLPELLSPAGSIESVHAAVNAGCDAVYIGLPTLSARGAVHAFSDEELRIAIDFCHLRGVKVYIAINIVYTELELPILIKHAQTFYEAGADAFILQDIGMAKYIKTTFPDIEIHASTQLTAQSLNDVLFLREVGFSRVILSREVSLAEIAEIIKKSGVGIEVFAHGALCVSYSGQCLMSGFIGRRSGNRGRCAQPCRQRYDLCQSEEILASGYLLSMKDLITYPFLQELTEIGITAIKIEGRSKNPEYVAQVTTAYRDRLDDIVFNPLLAKPSALAIRNLEQIFNRGGFTSGYFHKQDKEMRCVNSPKSLGTYIGKVAAYNRSNKTCKVILESELTPGDGIYVFTKNEPHPGTNINKAAEAGGIYAVQIEGTISVGDAVYKSYDKKLMDSLKHAYQTDTRKINVTAEIKAMLGEHITLTLEYNGLSVTQQGNIATAAEKSPVSTARIIEQLSKTGGTPFTFAFNEATAIDNNIFINMSELNELRRSAVEKLVNAIIQSHKRENSTITAKNTINSVSQAKKNTTLIPTNHNAILTVLVRNAAQFNAVIASKSANRIYFELSDDFIANINAYAKKCDESDIDLFAALPGIGNCADSLPFLENSGIVGYLCRNYGELYALRQTKKQLAVDFTFNITNSLSALFIGDFAATTCLSVENTFENIRSITATTETAELIVHGNIPVMTTKQCLKHLHSDCSNDTTPLYLTDKTGASFPVITNCRTCYAQIFSDRPLYMLNKLDELCKTGVSAFRLMLLNENADDILNLCLAYKGAITGAHNNGAEAMVDFTIGNDFTYGYYFKGFE